MNYQIFFSNTILVLLHFTSVGLAEDSNKDCQPNHNEQALIIALNADALLYSSLIAIEGAANFAMITDNGRFIEKKLEFIPDQGYKTYRYEIHNPQSVLNL